MEQMAFTQKVDSVSRLLDIAERCDMAAIQNGADTASLASLRKSALIVANSLMTAEVTALLGEHDNGQDMPTVYRQKTVAIDLSAE